MQAVILCAGKSSRFWPLSVDSHKSSFRLMGRPIIEYTIDSIQKSGIKDIIIIEPPSSDLKSTLEKRAGAKITFVTQREPKGMGNALKEAQHLIKDQFFVLNPYHHNAEKYIRPMIEKSKKTGSKMILLAAETSTPEKYGIFTLDRDRAKAITEKPKKRQAPSDMRVIGIYLLDKAYYAYYSKTAEDEYSFETALTACMQKEDIMIVITKDPTPSLKYPWDLLAFTKTLMDENLKPKISSKPEKNVIIKGKVHIGKNTKIYENAIIKGPVYIGDNCIIGNNAIIRDHTIIEDNVMIGANAEITRTIIEQGTHIHSGFIGDTIIDSSTKIGAGIITANKKIDRTTITATVKGKKISTNLTSLGAVIAKNTSIGINASTMPGVMIGSNVIIGSNTEISENIDDNTLCYTEFKKTKKKRQSP
ncbi:MAG: NDP-sugar synthase [archaeon]